MNNVSFPCPNNPKAYLEGEYGYIGKDAYFD